MTVLPPPLGSPATAHLSVIVVDNRQVIAGFKAWVSDQAEVLSLFVVAGGDDFLVHIAVPDIDALHGFLMDKLSKRREVLGFRSSVIYEHARNQVISRLD
jgi:DNA-binding Lrp family transcriptional regulator